MALQIGSLPYLIRNPQKSSAHPPLLLLLHGLGSNETDLMGLAAQLDDRFLIVSVQAPILLHPGAYAWFHVDFTPNGAIANLEEAEHSQHLLRQFIDELIERYSVNPQQVYLMGFSQGAIISLSLALTQPDRLAGVVAMSGRILAQVEPSTQTAARLPVFVAHGTADPVLPIQHGRASRDRLSALPVDLTYREYVMGHQISSESLRDIAAWLSAQLATAR
ncbi:MAG TPA: alpha/beta fold hydrolase [Coleofasciculaceae cyanobacterium]